MRTFIFFILTILGIAGLFSTSCISDDISSSPSDILTFSRDTVNFDTVFTGAGTPTARLVVANRAKKGIIISSIRLKNPNSNFQINVDGVSAREFHDVEIWREDSIYIFIECLIPESSGATPSRVEDELEFITNGVPQSVLLEAYGQNVVRFRNKRVTDELHLTAEMPYVVFDSLVVEPTGVLRIDPGVNLLFHEDASLIVHGRLEAKGTPEKMINFRGDRLDNVLPDISYDLLAGQWRGVSITSESYSNHLEYVDMRSTKEGLLLDSCAYNVDTPKLTLVNSWLHNSQGNVLTAYNSYIRATGVCFSEASNAVVEISSGKAEFLQCTFSNYYLFSAITSPIITMHCVLREDAEAAGVPMLNARFDNSIIYGMPKDFNSEEINKGDLSGTDVFFRNCSFKSEGENDDNFINCLWDTDPLFLTVRSDYYFNYHLQPDSPVIGMGDAALLTPVSMTDINGVNRLAVSPNGQPTLGAYARPEEPQEE